MTTPTDSTPGGMRLYQGACHCGAIGFTYQTELEPQHWPLRACQCSFCRAHGACSTSDPHGRVEFRAARPEHLQRYQFGQRSADFLVCSECGVYIGARMVTPKGSFAIINVNTLQPRIQGLGSPQAMSYDGESLDRRTQRREERWTPCQPLQ